MHISAGMGGFGDVPVGTPEHPLTTGSQYTQNLNAPAPTGPSLEPPTAGPQTPSREEILARNAAASLLLKCPSGTTGIVEMGQGGCLTDAQLIAGGYGLDPYGLKAAAAKTANPHSGGFSFNTNCNDPSQCWGGIPKWMVIAGVGVAALFLVGGKK